MPVVFIVLALLLAAGVGMDLKLQRPAPDRRIYNSEWTCADSDEGAVCERLRPPPKKP